MFRAVVFDMDGVITDTEKLYRRFQLEEGKKLGIPDDVMVVPASVSRVARSTQTRRALKMSSVWELIILISGKRS